jgi:hypothetical protein
VNEGDSVELSNYLSFRMGQAQLNCAPSQPNLVDRARIAAEHWDGISDEARDLILELAGELESEWLRRD